MGAVGASPTPFPKANGKAAAPSYGHHNQSKKQNKETAWQKFKLQEIIYQHKIWHYNGILQVSTRPLLFQRRQLELRDFRDAHPKA